jgi:hypothetical protein
MKKYVLTLFCLLTLQGMAQGYHPFLENTSWYERIFNFTTTDYYWIYKLSDTTINSANYTIYQQNFNLYKYYVREDTVNRQVFVRGGSAAATEELIYDFSLTPGYIFNYQGYSFMLDSINPFLTQLGSRNKFYFHCITNPWFREESIEGIGSKEHPMMFVYIYTDPDLKVICSYIGTAQYYISGLDTCPAAVYTSVPEEFGKESLQIYPNPARNTFTISLNEFKVESAELKMYDITGRQVFATTLNSKLQILNPHLSSGIYLVRVNGGEKVWQEKLVVE